MPKTLNSDRIRHRQAVYIGNLTSTWYNPATVTWVKIRVNGFLLDAYYAAAVASSYDVNCKQLMPKLLAVIQHYKPQQGVNTSPLPTPATRDEAAFALRKAIHVIAKAYEYTPDLPDGKTWQPVLAAFHAFALSRLAVVYPDPGMIGRATPLPKLTDYSYAADLEMPERPPGRLAERKAWHKKYAHIVNPYMAGEITLPEYKQKMAEERGTDLED